MAFGFSSLDTDTEATLATTNAKVANFMLESSVNKTKEKLSGNSSVYKINEMPSKLTVVHL